MSDLYTNNRWYSLFVKICKLMMFALAGYFTIWLIIAITIIQEIYSFINKSPISKLTSFTPGLNSYLYQIAKYLTGDTAKEPFPFSDWPSDETTDMYEDKQ